MRLSPVLKRLASPLILLILLPFAAASCGGGDDDTPPPPPKTVLSVSGDVTTQTPFTLAQIQAQPATTQTVSFGSGTGQQTHVYTGASLWSMLNQIGITTNAAVKNDVLAKYVIATGSDNYRALFAMGELSPDFGNRGNQVAYAETINGTSAALSSTDGPLRVTAPGDVKGGRYVSNLVTLKVGTAVSAVHVAGGGTTTQFQLSGAVTTPASFDLAALQALPAVTRTVGSTTYTGVGLWDLLNAAGIQTSSTVKNDVLGFYLIATGSDGYRVILSLAELSPDFGNQPDIVAYEMNGAPLTTTGFARLVIPGDGKAGRYVSNLVALEVISAPR
ncbi:molybdopterin-dependent oxidoreductase [Caballeronia sp. LZ065]|uniref:molybdopterin-dependent oxidoreductase n=1 Tax=Caballeronia sp. LZ065 TaxID=3038571 RepID=UPI002857F401|nr:molybdopterin-dependent oxidoreductase [Caballeronia sp. LZ065]MDR5782639.1 molybdopterin-dependent oxidoreductase [Caballeronia sp. LZ065]